MNRDNIEKKYKINTKDLFENDKEFEKEYTYLDKYIEKISEFNENIYEDQTSLYNLLELDEEISIKLEKIYVYANLTNDFDLANSKSNEKYGKALKLYNKYSKLSSFIIPEIITKDIDYIKNLISKNTSLKKYENLLLEIYREKEHILSGNESKILAQMSDLLRVPSEIISKLTNVDMTFGTIEDEEGKEVKLTNSNYQNYAQSKSREVRKKAFETFYKSYKEINETASEALASHVRNKNTYAKIKKYDSLYDKSLSTNNVDKSIYSNLISSVNNNLHFLQKQFQIRKEVLKLDELHLYDLSAPIVKEYEKKYKYEEAKVLVIESLKPLGEDYVKVIKQSFEENWIDVMPNDNKTSGAYCTCCYATHPYVLLNYEENYDNVSTITHELGHAMQYYYAQKNNSFTDYHYSIFVAEVASQVNEILLIKYMLEKSKEKEEKLFLLNQILIDFRSTVGRQTMFAEFEKNIYDYELSGEIITSDYLNKEYINLVSKYMGSEVKIDKEIMYEWSRVPHFYYDFYVYQYSTGFVAAFLIANEIYSGSKEALKNYMEFLKLGSTKDPVESLKIAGVNMLDMKNYDKAFEIYNEVIEEFKKIYNSEDEE
ncbi:MAG: oligoendopeptidase F [bacterium]